MIHWPKEPTYWISDRTLYVSIPFTWNLPLVHTQIEKRSEEWDRVTIGGPAAMLMPNYFDGIPFVEIKSHHPDALFYVNRLATKTMKGCVRRCEFCAVSRIEGPLREFESWKNAPIVIDNNLLACSEKHFERVIDGLVELGWADFNQGLDARLMTSWHANQIARIKKPMIRLALDSMDHFSEWEAALGHLIKAGIARRNIRSYALIGFKTSVEEAWCRCNTIEDYGVKVLPMWFHPLDALTYNPISEQQQELGWSNYERKRLMQWFYKHRIHKGKKD